MKHCRKCKTDKNETEFNIRNRSTGRLSTYCSECHREMKNAYYESDKTAYKERAKKRRRELVEWYQQYKSQLSCCRCGFSHPAALDFHHRDGATKEFLVSRGFKAVGRKRLLEEIAKCDVLCANCHRIEHYEEHV